MQQSQRVACKRNCRKTLAWVLVILYFTDTGVDISRTGRATSCLKCTLRSIITMSSRQAKPLWLSIDSSILKALYRTAYWWHSAGSFGMAAFRINGESTHTQHTQHRIQRVQYGYFVQVQVPSAPGQHGRVECSTWRTRGSVPAPAGGTHSLPQLCSYFDSLTMSFHAG
jgi:hypothetical protein